MTLKEFSKTTDMELCIHYKEDGVYWARYGKSDNGETIPNLLSNREIAEISADIDPWDEIFLDVFLKPIDK